MTSPAALTNQMLSASMALCTLLCRSRTRHTIGWMAGPSPAAPAGGDSRLFANRTSPPVATYRRGAGSNPAAPAGGRSRPSEKRCARFSVPMDRGSQSEKQSRDNNVLKKIRPPRSFGMPSDFHKCFSLHTKTIDRLCGSDMELFHGTQIVASLSQGPLASARFHLKRKVCRHVKQAPRAFQASAAQQMPQDCASGSLDHCGRLQLHREPGSSAIPCLSVSLSRCRGFL